MKPMLPLSRSTNREAFDRARKGASHGAAVVAEQQSAGRGRLGRSFFSRKRVLVVNADHPTVVRLIALLDSEPEGSEAYERIRGICKTDCIHSTYEFHHWLIDKGYLVVRPEPGESA